MRAHISQGWLLLLVVVVWGCGGKNDPTPSLPAYLTVPATLSGYTGSGLITVDGGGLGLRAEGVEHVDAATNTYSGVRGEVSADNVNAYFTVGQPRPYKEKDIVPAQYQSNGWLMIYNTITPGTYRMGINEKPGPRGEITDLILNLPGPQLYTCTTGSLTITESTSIKSQGTDTLYRIRGTFQVAMFASGAGATGKPIDTTGTFDLLLVKSI